MSLTPGERLGPYEILALVGAGGMGEVYRARDPRVGRDVAIKVSQERFSERFDREARAVAALNHPNICTLFDVGPNYLVMEYVEGEAPKGPLPWDEAVRVMRQIGDALSEAHEKGVVHRDLKPANIKIKADGTVKVLDFGLAKVAPALDGDSENSPTLSMAATQAGVILGTAGYMPPEQARGKPTDKRADIWAFGVVFHELLTGRRVFAGEDVTSTLAKVIEAEPSWQGVPLKVQRLLKKCLEKDPRKRLRDVGDAWELIEEAQAEARATQSGTKWLWPSVTVALAIIAAASAFTAWRVTQPVDHPLARLEVDLGADVVLTPAGNGTQTIAISPDGTRLAYISKGLIYTRRLDQNKASELPGTNGAETVFFSPDGRWLAFRSTGKINKISVEGGAIVPLMDLPNLAGASWGESGIVVGGGLNLKTARLPSEGGTAVPLMEVADGESFQAFPQLLPGGKAVLFSSYRTLAAEMATIEVATLSDHKRKMLTRGTSPHYVATPNGPGYLIYNNKATLFAVPFDPDRLEMHGAAIPILDDLGYAVNESQTAQYDVSAGLFGTGTLVYRKNTGESEASGLFNLESVVVGADGTGKREALRKMPAGYVLARLSPDGKRVALVVVENGRTDIWVYNQVLDSMARLTSRGEPVRMLCWSPDGKDLVFGSVVSGMLWARADGATQPQILLANKNVTFPWSFSADGKRLVYSEVSGPPQLWTVPITEDAGQLKAGTPEQFLKSQFGDTTGAFSPDGKWLAYSSGDQANTEVYVRAFPQPASGTGGKWQISNSGGTQPIWSPNGRDLLYRAGDQIMAVGYSVKDGAFQAEKPRVWLSKLGGENWDLDRGGKRVIVLSPVATQDAPKADHEVVFLQNFFDELRRKAPLGK